MQVTDKRSERFAKSTNQAQLRTAKHWQYKLGTDCIIGKRFWNWLQPVQTGFSGRRRRRTRFQQTSWPRIFRGKIQKSFGGKNSKGRFVDLLERDVDGGDDDDGDDKTAAAGIFQI